MPKYALSKVKLQDSNLVNIRLNEDQKNDFLFKNRFETPVFVLFVITNKRTALIGRIEPCDAMPGNLHEIDVQFYRCYTSGSI